MKKSGLKIWKITYLLWKIGLNETSIKMKNKPQEKDKNRTPFFTWRKDKGFVINGYLKEDKDGKTNS